MMRALHSECPNMLTKYIKMIENPLPATNIINTDYMIRHSTPPLLTCKTYWI